MENENKPIEMGTKWDTIHTSHTKSEKYIKINVLAIKSFNQLSSSLHLGKKAYTYVYTVFVHHLESVLGYKEINGPYLLRELSVPSNLSYLQWCRSCGKIDYFSSLITVTVTMADGFCPLLCINRWGSATFICRRRSEHDNSRIDSKASGQSGVAFDSSPNSIEVMHNVRGQQRKRFQIGSHWIHGILTSCLRDYLQCMAYFDGYSLYVEVNIETETIYILYKALIEFVVIFKFNFDS